MSLKMSLNIQWELKALKISDLKEHQKNPRQISKEQVHHLQELITKFGLIDKPIVNRDMTIIGGHQRIKILKKMKIKTVDCWVPNVQLEQEDIDRLCIGLNLNQGQWDWDILANQWEVTDLLSWGFTEEQLVGIGKESEDAEMAVKDGDGNEDLKDKKKKTCPSCGCEF